MTRALAAAVLLVACAPAAMAEPYPFEGRWDCEVAEFTFTATTYNPGDQVLEILDVAADGNAFVLTFDGGYQIGLDMNTDGTMDWLSGETGDSFVCRPLP